MQKEKGSKITIVKQPTNTESLRDCIYCCHVCNKKYSISKILAIQSKGPLCRECAEKL